MNKLETKLVAAGLLSRERKANSNSPATNRDKSKPHGNAAATIIFSILYLNTGSYFEGFGGALGTTASISVIVTMGIILFKKRFIKTPTLTKN